MVCCVQMKDECEIAEHCGWSLWLYLLVAPSHFAFVIEHQFSTEDCVRALTQGPLVFLFWEL